MQTGRTKIAAGLLAALMLAAPVVVAGPVATKLAGSIAGYVRDASGTPQMGASVLLYNRSERLIHRAITNERGIFGFDALKPDTYSIRVTLASFMPALRESILVQPGMQSLLYVDLASVLSSIELVYASPGQGALMSDDWKWTLKGAGATRSVLRALPEESASNTNQRVPVSGGLFSETRGLLNVSAGDPGSIGSASSESDLGTAFAVSTSLLGSSQLRVSGNVGYNQGSAMPTAGFRTSYSRQSGGPEISLTVQQVYFPTRPDLVGQAAGAPALRNISVAMHDGTALTKDLWLDYGASLDTMSFLGHVNYSNKFARLTYTLSDSSRLQAAFSSGAPPLELALEASGPNGETRNEEAELAEGVAALSMLPRISRLDGRTVVQRSNAAEVGYEKTFSSTRLNFSFYRESVINAAMTMVAPEGAFGAGDLLPDISSRNSVFDAGSYDRNGFTASVTQGVGENVELGVSAGRAGALTVSDRESALTNADQLRSKLQGIDRFWISARASAKLPGSGTIVSASYEWMDYSAMMPDHVYLTQGNYPETGLNVSVRQPIPSFLGMPGRLEASAELRNGLAQGYLPVSQGGHQMLIIQTPRLLRGGLSFIF